MSQVHSFFQARTDAADGKTDSALQKSRIALALNIFAIVLYIVVIGLILGLGTKGGASDSSSDENSNYNNGYSG